MKFIVLIGLIFSSPIWAQSGANMVGAPGSAPRSSLNERIHQLDGNRDGLISRAEAAGYPKLAKSFKRLDDNKDGVLSSDELLAFHDKARSRAAAKPKSTKAVKTQNG
ncbi:MAG: hypothetical protein QM533_06995 [Cytophagales bacterium]|nr:hypothetical protein [Cytophagales bacterium]